MVSAAVCQPLATNLPNIELRAASSSKWNGCGSNSAANALMRSLSTVKATGAVGLPHGEVLQVFFAHVDDLCFSAPAPLDGTSGGEGIDWQRSLRETPSLVARGATGSHHGLRDNLRAIGSVRLDSGGAAVE